MSHAHVVSFGYCEVDDCPLRDEEAKHVSITRRKALVATGVATAISYAWGEFDRQRRRIGHFEDGTAATIELGQEWVLDDLFDTLCSGRAALTSENDPRRWFWIDQLCIDQDNSEDVRNTLANIPDIYSAFDVAILMPGQACECFSTWYESYRSGSDRIKRVNINGQDVKTLSRYAQH